MQPELITLPSESEQLREKLAARSKQIWTRRKTLGGFVKELVRRSHERDENVTNIPAELEPVGKAE